MLNVSFLKNSAICYECTGLTLLTRVTGQKTACKAVLRFAKRFKGKRGTEVFTIVKFLY